MLRQHTAVVLRNTTQHPVCYLLVQILLTAVPNASLSVITSIIIIFYTVFHCTVFIVQRGVFPSIAPGGPSKCPPPCERVECVQSALSHALPQEPTPFSPRYVVDEIILCGLHAT